MTAFTLLSAGCAGYIDKAASECTFAEEGRFPVFLLAEAQRSMREQRRTSMMYGYETRLARDCRVADAWVPGITATVDVQVMSAWFFHDPARNQTRYPSPARITVEVPWSQLQDQFARRLAEKFGAPETNDTIIRLIYYYGKRVEVFDADPLTTTTAPLWDWPIRRTYVEVPGQSNIVVSKDSFQPDPPDPTDP